MELFYQNNYAHFRQLTLVSTKYNMCDKDRKRAAGTKIVLAP